MLTLAGAEDCAPYPAGRADRGALPYGRLKTVPGAGHHPWLDEPECFRDLIESLLTD
ncbi:MAG: hypothetical protein HOY79_14525 [Streptomyces sp.]|nr:hypothetical protein [Streptomyces sp.]